MKRVMAIAVLCLMITVSAEGTGKKKKKKKDEAKKKDAVPVLKDAIEILKKANDAAGAVKTVSYDFNFLPTGSNTLKVPQVDGKMVIGGLSSDGLPSPMLADLTTRRVGAQIARHYLLCNDTKKYVMLDHFTKKITEGTDKKAYTFGIHALKHVIMVEYLYPQPFRDEINGDKAKLEGTETVGGVECYKIAVTYKGGAGKSIWWFGKEDFLPRRVDRLEDGGKAGPATRSLKLSNVVVDPELSDDVFTLEAPDDYRKGTVGGGRGIG